MHVPVSLFPQVVVKPAEMSSIQVTWMTGCHILHLCEDPTQSMDLGQSMACSDCTKTAFQGPKTVKDLLQMSSADWVTATHGHQLLKLVHDMVERTPTDASVCIDR
jgi:hypothetical protein